MFCTQCGAKIDAERDRFCHGCGAKIQLSKPAEPKPDVTPLEPEKDDSAPVFADPATPASPYSVGVITQEPTPEENKDRAGHIPGSSGPSGVGGWLAFFVYVVCFIGVLTRFSSSLREFQTNERLFPELVGMADWEKMKIILYSIDGLASLAMIMLGVGLLQKNTRVMIDYSINAIWLAGPLALLFAYIVVGLLFGIWGMDTEFVTQFFISNVLAIVWTLYFKRSKRVRNTYWRYY